MREIVWQIQESGSDRHGEPPDAASAQARLEEGNTAFAELFDDAASATRSVVLSPADLGIGEGGQPPAQRPFATVLSCSDARVPVELLLDQRANDVFVVRVAGAVLSEGAQGSLDFAATNLPTVRLMAVLGHSGCGAVNAAVATYLDPQTYLSLVTSRPLFSLVKNLLGAVRLADSALHDVHGPAVAQRPGYAQALNDMSVVAGAAVNASALRTRVTALAQESDAPALGTVYGVYDLASRHVGLPGTATTWAPGFAQAPADGPALVTSLHDIAFGPQITQTLDDTDDA